ncbi:OmpA family protein [Pseudogemmobacter sonorensis]|uniref:OmpA family protein n=1 Tax=Pseudogemmobacter sonorensis TaxID=2989681 RepID=UPI0036C7F065
MPKRLLRLPPTALGAIAFALAGLVMLGISFLSVLVIESRSRSVIASHLEQAPMQWAEVRTDGMQVHLGGTAPNEAARFRALNLVGSVVDSSRIRDGIEVTPASALTPPRFSVEMLRNDDGIQLIGLVPETPDEGGLTAQALTEAAGAVAQGNAPTDMLQSAAWPAPAGWDASLQLGLSALELLKRSKISVSAGRVEITAIAESAPEKRSFEAELNRRKPDGVALVMDISAPRPVITPFTLRFIKDAQGARFDACSADTDRARAMILAAATEAGLVGSATCTVGLGTPTPRWSEGVAAAIRAVGQMQAGTVTFSDADITLLAGEGVSQADFDLALGELRAALPDVFSLEAIPPRVEMAALGPAEFTARLRPEGRIELRGRLLDEPQQAAVEAFARASFNRATVHVATRLDPELPDGWPIRVLAGLESLSLLAEGALLVRADLVQVSGVTGNGEARARITQILSSRLGQGQTFRVDVRYDERLDPLAGLPTPAECAAEVAAIMAAGRITFTPGSAEIAPDAVPVIDQLAEALAFCPGITMEIGGYTDSQGSDAGNLALSQARAEAVLMALLGRRVDTSGMVATGYGEANPIADNATEEGREANRRIEFVLIGDGAPAGAAGPEGEHAGEPGAGPEPEDGPDAGPDIAEEAPDDAGTAPEALTAAAPEAKAESAKEDEAPAAPQPALAEAGPSEESPTDEGPDFSHDTSPSVAPTEITIRPRPRPERD